MIDPIGSVAGPVVADLAAGSNRTSATAQAGGSDFRAAFAAAGQQGSSGCQCAAGAPAAAGSARPDGSRPPSAVTAPPWGVGGLASGQPLLRERAEVGAHLQSRGAQAPRSGETCGTCGELFRVDEQPSPTIGTPGTAILAVPLAGSLATSLVLGRWRQRSFS